ncbi:hypothetical protein HKD37_05G013278 [Glycine soja]
MEDIQAEFDIPEASDGKTKKKILQTIGERWRQFKYDLTRKWALATDKDNMDDTDVQKKAQAIQKQNTTPHVLSRGGYEYLEQKLMAEKTKKKLEEAAQSGSTEAVIDPSSPIRRHMARTKKADQMTSDAAKETVEKIVNSLEEQASQGSFVPHGCQDVLTVAIGLEPMQAQGLALHPEPKVGPSAARASTKESCVDPSGNNPETGDSDKCRLYIEENPPHLVALGKVYEGSTTVHNIPLLHNQVKVGVEEVKDVAAPVPVPTDEVNLVGQTLNTFLAWPTHLVKRLLEHGAVGPAKLADRPDHEVMWDATMFGVFNQDFPLYIKHEDLSEIAHGGQCLSIFVIELWILHLTETSMRAGNSDPQSIQRSGQSQFESNSYMKSWMQSSKCDVYLGAYLNGLDNYLKGIINMSELFFNTFALPLLNNINILMFVLFNSALKGLDDTPQPKSKAATRWIVVKYFNDVRPLEAERLKEFRIQWAQYYLKLRNQT